MIEAERPAPREGDGAKPDGKETNDEQVLLRIRIEHESR